MSVLFFHLNGIQKYSGGVSRTTDTLGRLFRAKGLDIWYLGIQNLDTEVLYDERQLFLPESGNCNNSKNLNFVLDFITSKHITHIINQATLNPIAVDFIKQVKLNSNVKVISCFHNSILTPIYYGAYQKEFLLKEKNLGFVFDILRVPLINKLMIFFYIKKNRNKYRSVVDSSDDVIVLCDGQKTELEKMCGIQHINKVKIIPNCQEPVLINPFWEEKEKIVLWVGTFDYSIKRPDNMLRIWKKVAANYPDWKLMMLGDGPSWKKIKGMANELNLQNIDILGRVSPSSFYKKASIVCVTSVHESFSLVTTEAHSYGLPVIAFNSFTAAPLVIENGKDGILVPPFDIEAYAEKLSDLMDNDKQRLSMSKEALKSIEKFSPETICSKWESILS